MSFAPESTTAAFGFQDDFQTTLSSAITASDTAISLALLPTPTEGTLVLEPETANEEEIYFTSSGAGVVNCPSAAAGRGVNSTAIAHNAGVPVKMLNTKAQMDVLKYGGALATGTATAGVRRAALRQEAFGTWVPVYTGFSSAPTNAVATCARFGNLGIATLDAGSHGTSNATTMTVTLPWNAKRNGEVHLRRCIDNGTTIDTGAATLTAGSNILTCYKDVTGAAWTNSGVKDVEFSIIMEIE